MCPAWNRKLLLIKITGYDRDKGTLNLELNFSQVRDLRGELPLNSQTGSLLAVQIPELSTTLTTRLLQHTEPHHPWRQDRMPKAGKILKLDTIRTLALDTIVVVLVRNVTFLEAVRIVIKLNKTEFYVDSLKLGKFQS